MSEQNRAPTNNVTVVRFAGWPRTDVRPTAPLVTLIFKGLSIFQYNRAQKRCEIGFLKNTDGKHKLRIRALENGSEVPLSLPSRIRMITLSLDITSKVNFFEKDGTHDFQNMLDLNSEEFWPGESTESEAFEPRLIVNHGTFLCLELTKYRFDRVEVPRGPLELILSPSNPSPLGRFLRVAGAEIGLSTNQKISLTVDNGTPVLLPRVDGHSVQIEFNNECNENGHECDFDLGSRLETRRSDFHFHREALSVSVFDRKYGLLFAPGQLTPDGLDIVTRERPRGTDKAPCMGVGSGEGDPP
jgi:hypothetical protein